MDKRIDLHLHSTSSDGTLTPRELVARARGIGLSAIAITDHDTIGGVREGIEAGAQEGIEVVPGIEIGIAHDPARHLIEIDILGYFIDPEHSELNEALELLQKAKNDKLFKQLAVLAQSGFARGRGRRHGAAPAHLACAARAVPGPQGGGLLRGNVVRRRLVRDEGLQPYA
ncbi:PHP domain-containing protein [bacterium]|nr:PHP domain-containing protein [bacterium]